MYDSFMVEYTKSYSVDSDVIEGVFFNENDNTVVLDVNDKFYRYSNVTQDDVASLVKGDSNGSVGAYYNRVFKDRFGPSLYLGHYDDSDYDCVPVNKVDSGTTTPKGLTDSMVTASGFSLSDASSISTSTLSANGISHPTKEFSLSSEPQAEVKASDDAVTKVVVHFTLNGDKVYKYVASNSVDVEGAIAELNDYIKKLNMVGRVRKVVVKFD